MLQTDKKQSNESFATDGVTESVAQDFHAKNTVLLSDTMLI